MRFALLMGAIFLFFAAVTYGLHLIFKTKRSYKYIPAVMILGAAFYNYYMARYVPSTEGFRDLAKLMVAVMFFAGAVSIAVSGLIIDFVFPRFKKKD